MLLQLKQCYSVGWGGAPGVNQWNGQWHSQPYWSGPYCYGNQTYTHSDNQVQKQVLTQQDGLGAVARTDQTPPPTCQDATPPPAPVEGMKDSGVHQPRIQQYCQTGYTTVPAVEHRANLPDQFQPHPGQVGKLAPSVQYATSYSAKKTAAHQDNLHNALPVNEKDAPPPQSQLLQTESHTGRPWDGCRESDRPSPARKRRSRWEQPAGQ